ncbi:A24 family peptidase [Clostridiaceae bacterium M8S5]|nr:A24 family peptidase [Clostridiaceae bacterium M8S5]
MYLLIVFITLIYSCFVRYLLNKWINISKGKLILLHVFSTIVALIFYFKFDKSHSFYKLVLLCTALMWIVVVDLEHKLVPNNITLILFIVGLVFVYINKDITKLMCCVVLTLLLTIISYITNNAFGMGDVKLLGVMCLFVGLDVVNIVMIASLLCSFLVAIFTFFKKVSRKTEIAFTPFIYIALLLSIIVTEV